MMQKEKITAGESVRLSERPKEKVSQNSNVNFTLLSSVILPSSFLNSPFQATFRKSFPSWPHGGGSISLAPFPFPIQFPKSR